MTESTDAAATDAAASADAAARAESVARYHNVGVILISHRMDDVFYVCDRVMAIFHGRNFAEAPLKSTSRNEVIGWIMGTRGHSAAVAHDRVH